MVRSNGSGGGRKSRPWSVAMRRLSPVARGPHRGRGHHAPRRTCGAIRAVRLVEKPEEGGPAVRPMNCPSHSRTPLAVSSLRLVGPTGIERPRSARSTSTWKGGQQLGAPGALLPTVSLDQGRQIARPLHPLTAE